MNCSGQCPLEEVVQHPTSPGPVADGEFIGRGAIHPDDVQGDGVVKLRFIPESHFLRGEVSVWRVVEPADPSLQCIASLIALPDGKRIERIFCITAGTVRSLGRKAEGHQRYCVLDECQIDDQGNSHPQHAHVSGCRRGAKLPRDSKDPLFKAALHELRTAFLAGVEWKVP